MGEKWWHCILAGSDSDSDRERVIIVVRRVAFEPQDSNVPMVVVSNQMRRHLETTAILFQVHGTNFYYSILGCHQSALWIAWSICWGIEAEIGLPFVNVGRVQTNTIGFVVFSLESLFKLITYWMKYTPRSQQGKETDLDLNVCFCAVSCVMLW